MPTVSNTSPLLNLAIIGRLDLVRVQFGRVVVPPAVAGEFRLEEGRPGSSALRRAVEDGWIAVEEPSDDPLIRTLRQDLDRGESEAITLAVEKEAGLILLDEREGRRRPETLGWRQLAHWEFSPKPTARETSTRFPMLWTGSKTRPGSGSILRFESRSLAGPNRRRHPGPAPWARAGRSTSPAP